MFSGRNKKHIYLKSLLILRYDVLIIIRQGRFHSQVVREFDCGAEGNKFRHVQTENY